MHCEEKNDKMECRVGEAQVKITPTTTLSYLYTVSCLLGNYHQSSNFVRPCVYKCLCANTRIRVLLVIDSVCVCVLKVCTRLSTLLLVFGYVCLLGVVMGGGRDLWHVRGSYLRLVYISPPLVSPPNVGLSVFVLVVSCVSYEHGHHMKK